MNMLKLKLFLISFAALILSGCANNSPVPGVFLLIQRFLLEIK